MNCAGVLSTGLAQSTYSSQCAVGVTHIRCALASGNRWVDIGSAAATDNALLATLEGQILPDRARRLIGNEPFAVLLPDDVIAAPGVPHTRTGKKLEVPVTAIMAGHTDVSLDPRSIDNPDLIPWDTLPVIASSQASLVIQDQPVGAWLTARVPAMLADTTTPVRVLATTAQALTDTNLTAQLRTAILRRKRPDGFFANPGEKQHFAQLGGQGISVVSYSDHQDDAFKYIKWFVKPEVQAKWWKLGGYSALRPDSFAIGGSDA